jgi:hypothetical protein
MVDFLLLKARLLTEGIRTDAEALGEVGTRYKEQNHGLFGWDFENHPELKIPDDFQLQDGTVVQFRLNLQSPYALRLNGERLHVCKGEETICGASLIPRPDFYARKTEGGNDMIRIGQVGGKDNLFFCYQNYCSHFSTNKQCAFCNLVSTSKTYGSVLKKKDREEIGEVAGAAFAEGLVHHISLTGGCFQAEKEVEVISGILESIRGHTGLDRVPGILLPSPAKGAAIRKYRETGIGSLGYSMEIWDEALYKALCPGKAEVTSHAEVLASIHEAVEAFGHGNVYVMLVMGLETRATFLEGVRAATDLGARLAPYVWAPNPGSKLSGHRAPFAEWYADTTREAALIVKEGGLFEPSENCCHHCDGNTLLMDGLREIGGDERQENHS